jgi:membrane-bound lytic murein transglycosylase B
MARFGRTQKASALLPLAVLSAAWTAGLATAGSDASASADPNTLPDGTRVPSQAVRAPASLTPSHQIRGHRRQLVATASASGIPQVALAAYERAATVIDQADHGCHLPWQLVAAIGRVESDHGRADGNVLTDKGIAKPGIYGPVLDGKHGTTEIRDTDAGQYDHDTKFDRAVGPMQFIPSTWAIVGVDADNDGQRNPQDIYDAALASGVYLCSGPDDLSSMSGQRSAVFRYNHSHQYVDLVLAIEQAYLAGDYTAVPNGTTSDGFTLGDPPRGHHKGHHRRRHGHHGRHHHGHHGHHGHQSPTGTNPSNGPTTGPTAGPTNGPTGAPPTSTAPKPPTVTVPGGGPTVTLPTLPTLPPLPTPTLLTRAQAIAVCLARGLINNPVDPNDAFDRCVYDLTH